jgi:hypothetical protein
MVPYIHIILKVMGGCHTSIISVAVGHLGCLLYMLKIFFSISIECDVHVHDFLHISTFKFFMPVYCNFLTCMPGAIFHIYAWYTFSYIPWSIPLEHYIFLKGFAFILFLKGITNFENNLNAKYVIFYILHQAHK